MKKSTLRAISFISGLTLTAVVVGVTISKNPKIRSEIENQINSCLKATRTMVDAFAGIARKTKTATSLIKGDSGGKTPREAAAEAEVKRHINNQWDTVEAQHQERT